MFALILPAGGSGTRLGGTKKQFRTLSGAPMLLQTIGAFYHHPQIAQIIIPLPDADFEEAKSLLNQHFEEKVLPCLGGQTRSQSVQNALQLISPELSFVLVHDAVRPFMRQQDIEAICQATIDYGACVPVLPVSDTLRKGELGVLNQTVAREDLFRMQTPQGFNKAWLIEAYHQAELQQWDGTDDCEFVQRIGKSVHYILGNPLNLKVTTPEDWAIAEILWEITQRNGSK